MANTVEEAVVEVICAEARCAPLAGRYSEVEAFAKGSFSMVLRAHDDRTGKRVVLKFLSPMASQYRAACFVREEKVSSALVGRENVIQLTGGMEELVATLDHAPSGSKVPLRLQYFALEEARETLTAALFGGKRPRSVHRRLERMRDVVKGVARLHRIGYCHRDLKPDNIFICAKGVAKVADLGTCRLHSGTDPIATNYHMPVGDLMYAAPEMFFAGGLDPTKFIGADWFSVGSMIFEAVTGQVLYVAIGLRDPKEIISRLGAVADLREYDKRVERTAGRYPIPGTNEFSEPWLSSISASTHHSISGLVRDLCNFNYRERLVGFETILRRLDIAIIRARRDQEGRRVRTVQ